MCISYQLDIVPQEQLGTLVGMDTEKQYRDVTLAFFKREKYCNDKKITNDGMKGLLGRVRGLASGEFRLWLMRLNPDTDVSAKILAVAEEERKKVYP